MKRALRGLAALVSLGICVSAFAQVEPNAFLNRHAYTKSELKSQVKADPAVADRYMRHFGKSKEEVGQMIDGLTLARLPEGGVFVVYNVPGWSELRAQTRYMRKGTLVWQDATGRPILKASCGNPLVRGTDIGLTGADKTQTISGAQSMPSATASELGLPETNVVGIRGEALVPSLPEVSAAELVSVVPSAPFVPAAPAAIGGLGLSWLAIPGIIGTFALLDQGNTPPPVPEPASLTVLAAGLGLLAARRAKRKA